MSKRSDIIKYISLSEISNLLNEFEIQYKKSQNFNNLNIEDFQITNMLDLFYLFDMSKLSPLQYFEYPYGIIAKQPEFSNLYRGENKIYGTSKATLYRNVPLEKDDQTYYFFKNLLNLRVFENFLLNLPKINESLSTVIPEALAQHYGLKTSLIDITNNPYVALFFATCKYNNDLGQYEPLNYHDINNLGHKYGVLFIRESLLESFLFADTSQSDNKPSPSYDSKFIYTKDFPINIAVPIGKQILDRCHNQYAYVYPCNINSDLYKSNFTVYYFEQNPEFSYYIYQLMDGGKRIFPDEKFIKDHEPFIKKIINNNIVSYKEKDFIYIYDNFFKTSFTKEYILELLDKNNITIYN